MIGRWIALFTLGSFCVLASYAYGDAHHAMRRAEPVNIVRDFGPPTRMDYCGFDRDCLLAWAEEDHPAKHKRRKS